MIRYYCVALCIVSCAFGAHAQDQEVLLEGQDVFEWMQAEYQEDYVVSASKRKQKLSEVPAQVSVITREQIERSGSTSLGEILRQIPNLHVMRVSNGGYRVVPRGYSDKYLLLVDGIERNSISNLTPDPMAFFAVTDIERIEFVHGPGSTMYGANAYSGILNIITRRATEPGTIVWAESAGGQWNQKYVSSGVRGQKGPWDYTTVVAANNLESHSPYARGDAEFYSVRGTLGYSFDTGHSLRLSVTGQEGRFPGVYPNGYNFESPDTSIREAALNYTYQDWRFNSFVRKEQAELILGGLTGAVGGGPTTQQLPPIAAIIRPFVNDDLIWDNEVLFSAELENSSLLNLGTNYRFKANRRYLRDDTSMTLPYRSGDNEWRIGSFVSIDTEVTDKLLVSAGLRGDLNSSKQNLLNPRLSVIYRPATDTTFRLGYLQAFRKPTAQELGEQLAFEKAAGAGTLWMTWLSRCLIVTFLLELVTMNLWKSTTRISRVLFRIPI